MRLALLLLALLVASPAGGVSPTFTRQSQGGTAPFEQVDCTVGGTDVVVAANRASATAPLTYDRLSILIKNCEATGASAVAICPDDATCSATEGFLLDPREGIWLDWSNNGAIGCIGIGGTATVCYIEERG